MKVLFLAGTRAVWGYSQPVADLCRERGIDYEICCTNMMMLPAYGDLLQELRREGYNAQCEIYNSLEGHNHFTMAKSLSIFMSSFVDLLVRVQPTWLVLTGDTGEQLMGAVAAGYCYVATAHIQAGEVSGNIDGVARHAIGKFAHIHFAANKDAADRLRKLGEEEFRVHQVGHPGLDPLARGPVTAAEQLLRKYSIDVRKPTLLVIVHPVTEDFAYVRDQAQAVIAALKHFPQQKVWILPNNDAGAAALRDSIERERIADTFLFKNVPRPDYAGFMRHALCMVGNSSAGLIEAPTFELPAVNIGRRQHCRVRGKNVIDVPFETEAIVAGIVEALSEEFRESLKGMENPYGDGRSSERILDVLERTPIDDRLLVKRLVY